MRTAPIDQDARARAEMHVRTRVYTHTREYLNPALSLENFVSLISFTGLDKEKAVPPNSTNKKPS